MTQAALIGQDDYRTQNEFTKVSFSCALSFEHCQQALADERLSSRFWDETIGQVWGHTIIGMDGSEHREHRALISQAFTRRSLSRWQETAIVPAVNGLIDRFEKNGSADLYREFTLLFPVYIITEMMGLPFTDIERFNKWAGETVAAFYDMESAKEASKNLERYLSPLIEERRGGRGEDLITLLANAELDGSRLETIGIVSFLRLLLPAGLETTYRSSGNLLYLLLTHPDQLDAVQRDRGLIPAAIEEALRFETPLVMVPRMTTEDVEIRGVPIAAGAQVNLCIGSANRDETRWADAGVFDIRRPRRAHISFAGGIHSCLGMHLARVETRAMLNSLFDRVRDLRLVPDEDTKIVGMPFRSPTTLPVTFSAA